MSRKKKSAWVTIEALRAQEIDLRTVLRKLGWKLAPTDGVFLFAERPARWSWEEEPVIAKAKTPSDLKQRCIDIDGWVDP